MPRLTPADYLRQLRNIARERKGKLLSPEYLGDATKLRWRCAEGHVFDQPPTSVKQGKWCRRCGSMRTGEKRRAPQRARLYQLVAERGGQVLSDDYKSGNTRMRFRCADGHEWMTSPIVLLKGGWCKRCSFDERVAVSQPRIMARLARVAKKHGGEVIGCKLVDGTRRYELRCALGHQWIARTQSIDNGVWCQVCRHERYLNRIRKFAADRGGVLLSADFVNEDSKVRCQCSESHRFTKRVADLMKGSWCPRCGYEASAALKRAPSIERLQRIVADKGGTIVTVTYESQMTPMWFRCSAGHEWQTTPYSIWEGSWCRECQREYKRQHPEYRQRIRDQINAVRVEQRLQQSIEEQGGRLLAPGFVNWQTPLQMQCQAGHGWTALPGSLERGTTCQQCKVAAVMAEVREQATRHDGECLSTTCRTVDDLVELRCVLGHRFQLEVFKVRKGQWCPICAHGKPQGMNRMHQLAQTRGGECLSLVYEGIRTKLQWICAEGHRFMADPGMVFRGHWCPECANWASYSRKRLSIEDMHQTAAGRGGACLSKEYHGNKVALRWRCARGHAWSALPNRIRQGSWCPACAHSVPGTLESMKVLALQQGGRCLTTSWNNRQLPLRFECAAGHRFEALISAMKTGVWCPECASPVRRASRPR